MESEDLTPSAGAERMFDERLRLALARPPLPDDGFSRRVVAALPRARLRAALRRPALIASGLVVGATFNRWINGPSSGATQVITDVWHSASTAAWFADPALWLIGAVSAACLAWAFQRELRELIDI